MRVWVVGLAVAFTEHFCFKEGGEGFSAQKLVPEPAVETLAVGVLSGATGLDEERFDAPLGDPVLHRPRDKFRTIAAADELEEAAPRVNRRFQNEDHLFGCYFTARLEAAEANFLAPWRELRGLGFLWKASIGCRKEDDAEP